MKNHEEFFQKCAVLLRNGAVFFSTAYIVRGLIDAASRLMERFGEGYEPFFFLFLSVLLILSAALLFPGESGPASDEQKTDPAGAAFLLLFISLPADGLTFVVLRALLAAAALTRLPRLFRGTSPAAVMAGCAGAGIPAVLFQPAEPFVLVSALLFLLIFFPRKLRIPAILLAGLILTTRVLLPFPAEEVPSGEEKTAKGPDSETIQLLHRLTLLACAEAGDVPQAYQCITMDGGSFGSPGRLSLAALAENAGDQTPKQFLESDVLRRETLSMMPQSREDETHPTSPVSSSAGETSSDGAISARSPSIFLFDPGRPVNFRTHFRCTENYFRRLKASLPEDAIVGFLLPEKPDPYAAATLSAVRETFPHTVLFLFPAPMVLASSERVLSGDPEELDRRAVRGQIYEKLFSPYHILNLALPHFQEPVAVSSLLDAAVRSEPNRTDRLISFGDPASKKEVWFAGMVKISLPLTAGLFLLYVVLRYFIGWKPTRKSAFRAAEAGFLFTGSAFFLASPFLRSIEPDPAKWFPVCLSVVALGSAWAFSYAKGKRSTNWVPRVVLPLIALACVLFFEPVTVWGLFFAALFMGAAWKNALESAVTPLTGPGTTEENTPVLHVSIILSGCALALLLVPPLFFVPHGLCCGAAILAVILVTRRPAVVR